MASASRRLWAVGDESKVYLLLAQPRQGREGFQIFLRERTSERFFPGQWYSGRPVTIAVYAGRLVVFLSGGGCHSYSLDGAVRSEPRLPTGMQLLHSFGDAEQLYALVRAEKDVSVAFSEPLIPPTELGDPEESNVATEQTSEPTEGALPDHEPEQNSLEAQPEDAKTVEASAAKLLLSSGDYALISHGVDNQWHCLCRAPLPISHWKHSAAVLLGEKIYLFGIEIRLDDQTRPFNNLGYCSMSDGYAEKIKKLPLENVQAFTPLLVNHQLRLIVSILPEDASSADSQAGRFVPGYLLMGRPDREAWSFSDVFKSSAGEMLRASPLNIGFATWGQDLVFLEAPAEGGVRFARFSPADWPPRIDAELIEEITPSGSDWQRWIVSHHFAMTLPLLALCALLVYWRRAEAFEVSPPLPRHLQLAPLWRRGLAFSLDTIGPIVITCSLFPQYEQIIIQTQTGTYHPQLLEFYLTLHGILVGYLTVCEILFAATPAKKALRLTVADADGSMPSPKQILLRNLLRFLELHVGVFFIFVIVIVTARRQRLGDLVARTIVIYTTPNPPRDDRETPDQADYQEDSSTPSFRQDDL